jgi:hypothetical protein
MPTGFVAFRDGSAVIGSNVLSGSSASLVVTNRLNAGNHYFTVVYSGDTNYYSSLSAFVALPVLKQPLTVSGITANSKVYDAKTMAVLVLSNAIVSGVLPGDNAVLNTGSARGNFSSKNVGSNKAVTVTGFRVTGPDAANYSVTPPSLLADITAANLTVTARGVNKIYDGTASATVVLSDNRFDGDVLADAYASAVFTNMNVGSRKVIFVSGITISGTDSGNYMLVNTNATATASIAAAVLTVSGITASNKVYDAKTTATLNLGGALLNGAVGGDILALVTSNARGTFANKNVGNNKTVAIAGLSVSGTNAANYSFARSTTLASITPANLTVTAKGVNKSYDGGSNATVALSDSRFAGDAVTDAYASAAFISAAVGTNKPVNVTGINISGADAPNYSLQNPNATTTASILAVSLLVKADNQSRPFGIANPVFTFSVSGFVNGETASNSVSGQPTLNSTATTNSVAGNYPITITAGTLAAANYVFGFSSGVLTVTPAPTTALLTSTLNPARTNQNITFITRVSALNSGAPAPSGQVRFKCNGTNSLGAPVGLTNGATTLVIPAATIASSSAVLVTAEFSDPAGNFNNSSNTMTQTIVLSVTPPPSIGRVSIAPPRLDGTMQAKLEGSPGQPFVLEASGDLIHWTPVSTNIADTNGIATLVESNSIAFPSRFYRGRRLQ